MDSFFWLIFDIFLQTKINIYNHLNELIWLLDMHQPNGRVL